MKVMGIFLRFTLLAAALIAIFLTICGAPAAAAQTPVATNDLNGTWVNAGPNTNGFARIVIDGTTIHPYGACQPRPCDWGIVEGRIYGASVRLAAPVAMTATFVTNFDEVVITLLLESDGRLRVDSFTHFTDGSRRADYHGSGYLVRAGADAGADAEAQPPAVTGDMDGIWNNVDAQTRGLVQIEIRGNKIHPYGACHPDPCDWGTLKAKSFATNVDSGTAVALTANQSTSFSRVEITLSLERDGRLRAELFTHFTDESGRADYRTVNYFIRHRPAYAP